ncbi:MAG: hypothetical protein JSV89_02335 [Spirochaetaceae bacterium]|nr:MAG: hypothetical protein JSV89_02335 [Spirochaetaceae bacterium]
MKGKTLMLCVAVSLMSSCAMNRPIMHVNPSLKQYDPKVFVILPFVNRDTYNKEEGAPYIVRDAFEASFIKTGYQIVSRDKMDLLLEEIEFSVSDISDSRGIQIASMLDADAVILGTILEYGYLYIGLSVKAIDVETGAIIWQGSYSKKVPWYRLEQRPVLIHITETLVDRYLRAEKKILAQ